MYTTTLELSPEGDPIAAPSAKIVSTPARFDRVDRVKRAVGQQVLPGDDRFWILGDPLIVEVGNERIEVPVGFTTDGASVPRLAQKLTGWDPWTDPQRWAGVVHDWLYSQPNVSKSHADSVFRALLAAQGASRLKRDLMYAAVVAGGWLAYRRDQERGPRIFVDSRSQP
jgi:hypothetical protein